MRSNNNRQSNSGVGFLTLLFLLFIGLKLSGHIAWSWWWITAPLWGGPAALVGFLVIWFSLIGAVQGVRAIRHWRRK